MFIKEKKKAEVLREFL